MNRIRCSVLAVVTAVFLLLQPMTVSAAEAPSVSAKAAVLMVAQTGEVLYDRNAQEKLPVASTTKIMTTLLCLESGDLDTEFVVDAEAIRVEGSSMGLQEGDVVTKRALCCGMLLPSGNDAANAAAVAIAGSQEAFAELMNQRAAQLGMTRSWFVTPSGLDAEGHGASAKDMATLTRAALQNEAFRSICSQSSVTVQFGNPPYARNLYNTNKLLTRCEGVIGVKTGFTDAAGRCLVSACERDGMTLICVTLNAPDDWNDHEKLYEYGFSRLCAVEPELPQNLSIPVVGAEETALPVYARESITVAADRGDLSGLTMQTELPPFFYAPVTAGEQVGSLIFSWKGQELGRVPLYVRDGAESKPAEHKNAILQWLDSWKRRLFGVFS